METKGKYIIAHDTICEGMQCQMEGEEGTEDRKPVLYNNEKEARLELFDDAIAGLEGTDDDYFEENELDKTKVLSEMRVLLEEGDNDKIRNYLQANSECNYHDESVESAEGFVIGGKAIFTGTKN